MTGYHGREELKSRVLAELAMHRKAEEWRKARIAADDASDVELEECQNNNNVG